MGRAADRNLSAMKRYVEQVRAGGSSIYDVPNVCKKSRYLLTNEDTIEVQEKRTSCEVEYVLIVDKGEILVTVGTDVNDSTLLGLSSPSLGKVHDTAKSKQACPAVVARDAWLYEEVRDHWDQMRLKSRVIISGKNVPYQDFPLALLRDPGTNFRDFPWLKTDGTILLSGSSGGVPDAPAALYNVEREDGIFPDNFHMEIFDPVLDRSISHSFRILHLDWPDSDISP